MKTAALVDFTQRGPRAQGWFRFFVPLDGLAVALDLNLEASGAISAFKVSDTQSEALKERPRAAEQLIGGARDRCVFLNLLLDEMEIPWATLAMFKRGAGASSAIIEAAEERRLEILRARRHQNEDCA